MRLYYIGIIRNKGGPPHEIVAEKDLSTFSFFSRNNLSELMTHFAETVAENTEPAQRQMVQQQDYLFHAYARTEGICGIITSDDKYPNNVANRLLARILDEFLSRHLRSTWDSGEPHLPFPELKDYISKYQDPEQADDIMKIQKELDETKVVLHKALEDMFKRGDRMEDLVEKSDRLSASSKMFYRQAKKQNSCCVLM